MAVSFLTTNGIEVSPIQISEKLYSLIAPFIAGVAGENIRTKSFFGYLIFEDYRLTILRANRVSKTGRSYRIYCQLMS
jgi:hypothetical protein